MTKAKRLLKQVAETDKKKRAEFELLHGNRRAQNIEVDANITEPIQANVLTLEEMLERFVFIGSTGAIVDRRNGRVRKGDIAGLEYAASTHVIGKTAVAALKLWMKTPGRSTVDVLAWVPGAPEICTPPETGDGAKTALNTWRGFSPMPAPKNWRKRAKPFLDHVAYLVPIKEERTRFLQWLAHIVQHPEILPHTSYLMITKTTGIGRNLLAAILTRALRGYVASGVSLPELLDGGFNGRLGQKLLATVDELKEGAGEGRYRRQQKLSSIITEEHRHINPKYGVQTVEKNCCRWLMFSNYYDALPFSNVDRRIIVINNPIKDKQKSYYTKLYNLVEKNKPFIASVRKYLETLNIDGFNPGEHAPMNKAKLQALDVMTSDTDRAVQAFKDECMTDLTSVTQIRQYVKSCDVQPSDAAPQPRHRRRGNEADRQAREGTKQSARRCHRQPPGMVCRKRTRR